jgi:membrane fusion protein, macrolide-specific efflux system
MPPKPSNPATSSFTRKVWTSITSHKIISAIVAVVVIYGGYSAYNAYYPKTTSTSYVTTTATTGTVVASESETGQVSASSNITVESESSGEVISLPVTAGEHVVAGQAIAYLDPTTAQENVTTAEQALEESQISLSTTQASLVQSRATGYNDVSSAFLNLPSVVSGLQTVLYGTVVPGHPTEANADAFSNMTQVYDPNVTAASSLAESSYQTAAAAYDSALATFEATPSTAAPATIDALITQTNQAVSQLATALRASTNFLNEVNSDFTTHDTNPPSPLAGQITTLTGYTTTTTSSLNSLSNDVTNLAGDNPGAAATSSEPLVIQSAQLDLQGKQDALAQAELALSQTVVRAPFSGTVGELDVQQYETIGNGASVATLVSDNQNVQITVNEVDAAKLKVGEKATITFDALPNVSIAGTVSSVNTVGTVSSGVVSYNAVVTFDTPNGSVEPGMSATTDIITGTETGVVVPESAVTTTNGRSFVQVFSPPLASSTSSTGAVSATPPTPTAVTTGLTDNTNIIIETGISAGTQVVTQTIANTSATTPTAAAQSTSLFGAGGIRTGGGFGGGTGRGG